jgi:hypothetical protein
LTFDRVTVIFEIEPLRPETTRLEGYGIDVPPPASGMLMPHPLVNVLLTCVTGQFTVWVKLPLLVEKLALATYIAWMSCLLSVSVLAGTRQVAVPDPLTATFAHNVVAVVLSTKFTTPVLTVALLVVFDVKVTAWFLKDGFNDDMIVVVVARAAGVVTISSDHPPEIVA